MKKLLLVALVAISVTGCKKTYVCNQLDVYGAKTGVVKDNLTEDEMENYSSQYYEDIVGNPTEKPMYDCKPE